MQSSSYFSHDSGARNSDKLLQVRMKFGAEGYGIYFMILERLREEKDYMSVKDYSVLSFDLRADENTIKSIVEDFGLFDFTEDGEKFYSQNFLERMELKDKNKKALSEAGKKGAKKRWDKKGGDSEAKNNSDKENRVAITEPKKSDDNPNGDLWQVKKSKVKESKVNKNNIIPAENSADPKSEKVKYPADNINYQIAEMLYQSILDINPEAKKPNFQNWADDIRLMHERDKRDYEKIKRMIKWSHDNDFWSGVILSAKNLRKQYDKMAAQANSAYRPTGQPKHKEIATDWSSKPVKQPAENKYSEEAMDAMLAKITQGEAND